MMFLPYLGFGMVAGFYALLFMFLVFQIFVLFFTPSMLTQGARPLAVGKAVYCYLLQGFGIILMSAGGLPAVNAVTVRLVTGTDTLSTEMYLALLIIFSFGGLTFLWHEKMAQSIDDTSKRVCSAVYWFSLKLVGYILCLVSLLAFFLTLLFLREMVDATWWIMPTIFFLYGLLLSWCTRTDVVASAPLRSIPSPAPAKTLVATTPSVPPVKKPLPPSKNSKKMTISKKKSEGLDSLMR